MAESPGAGLDALDLKTVTGVVKNALGSDSLEVLEWRIERMIPGVGGGPGGTSLNRVSGLARDESRIIPWTVILKILHAQPDDKSGGSHYWKREAELYRSGFLETLPPCLAAPRCFGVTDHPNNSWLWLEEVKEEISNWPLERYGLAAQHLGEFNAMYLTRSRLPEWPWLSASWIRDDVDRFGAQIDHLRENLSHPLLRRFVPGDAASNLFRLWDESEATLTTLDGLPQTLCHFDAFRRNMFARRTADGDQTVLIDWAFLGPGPLGAEMVSLVLLTLVLGGIPLPYAQELERVALDGYVKGLHNGGWQGDPQQVRVGFATAIALRRLAMIGQMVPWVLDETRHAMSDQISGLPMAEFGDRVAQVGEFVETIRATTPPE